MTNSSLIPKQSYKSPICSVGLGTNAELTYRNNDADDADDWTLLPVKAEAAAVVSSLSLLRKKAMATPKLSVRFIKNLFFLSIGAEPTATRCTLIFFGLLLMMAVEEVEEEGGDWMSVVGDDESILLAC